MGKSCNGCGMHQTTEMATVTMSAAGWELHEERHARDKRWLCVIIIMLVIALIASNVAWIVYESQFETAETCNEYNIEQHTEGDGDNNAVIGGGRIINGTTDD